MSVTGNLREEGARAFSGARLVPEIGNSATRTPGAEKQTAKTEGLPGNGLNGEAHCRHCILSLSESVMRATSAVVPAPNGGLRGSA